MNTKFNQPSAMPARKVTAASLAAAGAGVAIALANNYLFPVLDVPLLGIEAASGIQFLATAAGGYFAKEVA